MPSATVDLSRRVGTPFDQFSRMVGRPIPTGGPRIMPPPSQQSVQQRKQALNAANAQRRAIRELKQEMRAMPWCEAWPFAAQILTDDPERIEHMELHKFLMMIPGFSRPRVKRVCWNAHVWPLDLVSELTSEQRSRTAWWVLQAAGRS